MASSTIPKQQLVKIVTVSGTVENLAANSGTGIGMDFSVPDGCSTIIAVTPYLPDAYNLVSVYITTWSMSTGRISFRVWNGRTTALESLTVSARIVFI